MAIAALCSYASASARLDFDGDGKTDPVIYRESSAAFSTPSFFWIMGSSMGLKVYQWGIGNMDTPLMIKNVTG